MPGAPPFSPETAQLVMELAKKRQRAYTVENQLLQQSCQSQAARNELKAVEEEKRKNEEIIKELQQEQEKEDRLHQELQQMRNTLVEKSEKLKAMKTKEAQSSTQTVTPCLLVSRCHIHGDPARGFLQVAADTALVITTAEFEGSSVWYFGYALNKAEQAGWLQASDTRPFIRSEFCGPRQR